MAEDYNINFDINAKGLEDAEEKFLALGSSIDKARADLDEMRNSNKQGSAEFQKQKKELEEMESAYRDLNKEIKGVDASFEDVYGEVKPLTAALGEAEDRLYQLALAGDTTSKEYQELMGKVSSYRKIQMDTDMAVDAAATTMSQKLGGAIQGAAGGFAIAQGAMGVFGGESEKLEETLLKVNAAMAISQGIEGLREGSKSFKALGMSAKAALKGIKSGVAATGIGVFLIAVGAIAANWDRIKSAVSGLSQAQKDLTAQTKLDLAASESKYKTITNSENVLRLSGKTEEEIRNMKIKQLEATLKISEADLDRQKQTKEGQIKAAKRNEKILEGVLTFLLMPLKVLNATYDKIRSSIPKSILNLPRVDILGSVTKALYSADDVADDLNEGIEDSQDKIDELKNQIAGLKLVDKAEKAKMLKAAEDKDKKEVKSAKWKAKTIKDVELTTLGQRNAAEIEMTQDLIDHKDNMEVQFYARQKQRDLERREQAQATAEAIADTAIKGLRLVSSVADLFASKDKKAAKRAFNIKKAADIAEATMSGYKAVITTFANAPGGVVLKGIQAGIAGAFAAVQIAKIASAKFESGETPADLGDVPSGDGGGSSEMAAPQFNIVGDSGINQLAALQQQPTKAFVVSGEVTTAQSLDRNKINNATI